MMLNKALNFVHALYPAWPNKCGLMYKVPCAPAERCRAPVCLRPQRGKRAFLRGGLHAAVLLGITVMIGELSGCGSSSRLKQNPLIYPVGYEERGIASWYGPGFQGNRTASGERFDKDQLTAAHRTLPMGSVVRVRSLSNGREVTVRINDRGPFARHRIVDLSEAAARTLGMTGHGTDRVVLRVTGFQGHSEIHGFLRIQVASFSERENALALAARLKRHYQDVQMSAIELPVGKRYRVCVGRFASYEQASALADELDARLNVESIVIRDDV
ncbi:MAG: septal ring lytic transglycosylase RlpA family protein [Nitrospiraceae bacterium]|nr:septal ring lytic transglycosylase RlpA family protein [Nitrospiraceae bacterium]